MARRSRRHSTGFGYIGFGNNQSTFNQKTSTPFSVYKEKLDLEAHLHYEMEFMHRDLTKADKEKIKNKIRRQERKLFRRTVVISLIVFAIVAYITYYLINQILSH
ncbi:FeoB-associated Cys-rich membrane protein [Winogradskyella aquimaris]|uniref:FeoB-associated Cys-rich membrane protein n=1 Tax=Winogradskyella aquimaris TaxID=864074 RepID=A0ABU5ESY9_9FLAO|nr:FeoB-associated Cys-rich membrane protein [Winogradskyella aquimaris]MDY2588016.1 FeoB-associated Cys-rich membrane protein [Winogradskyella aquimaris]